MPGHEGAQGCHDLATEELGDRRWVWSQSIPVHGGQELREKRNEKDSSDDRIVEVKLGQSECQRRVCGQEKPDWIHWLSLLLFFSVQHHVASRNDAGGHLEKSPNRMEASQIPNQRHHHFAINRVLMVAVEASSLRIGDLLQERDSPQSC